MADAAQLRWAIEDLSDFARQPVPTGDYVALNQYDLGKLRSAAETVAPLAIKGAQVTETQDQVTNLETALEDRDNTIDGLQEQLHTVTELLKSRTEEVRDYRAVIKELLDNEAPTVVDLNTAQSLVRTWMNYMSSTAITMTPKITCLLPRQ